MCLGLSARCTKIGLLLLVSAVGCENLQDILNLQRALAGEFNSPAVNVNVSNGTDLTVTFQNSPIASLPDSVRKATCRRVAEFVRDHYSSYSKLQVIRVGFATRRSFGPVTTTNFTTPCAFVPRSL